MVEFNSINVFVTSVIVLNLFIGVGNYFIGEYDEAGFLHPTVSYGNISDVNVDNATFSEAVEQIEGNPVIAVITSVTSGLRTIFLGVPVAVRDVMDLAGVDETLVNTIYISLIAVISVCYILFLINMVSYLRGGGT